MMNQIVEANVLEKCGHKIHVNWYSTDCDGVSGEHSSTFDTVADFQASISETFECAEGSVSFEVVAERNMVESRTSAGGWDVN